MEKIIIKAISFDFWNTLYKHNYTNTKRKEIRDKAIECFINKYEVTLNHNYHITNFFSDVDAFVKKRWMQNLPSSDNIIIDYLYNLYNNKYPKYFLSELLNELYSIYENKLKPIPLPNVDIMLKTLSDRFKLFIISDTYTIKSGSIERILQKDKLSQFFTEKYFSDIIGEQKPSNKAIDFIKSKEGIGSKNILHIGDLIEKDYQLAENSGCYFIHYSTKEDNPLNSSLYLFQSDDYKEIQTFIIENLNG